MLIISIRKAVKSEMCEAVHFGKTLCGKMIMGSTVWDVGLLCVVLEEAQLGVVVGVVDRGTFRLSLETIKIHTLDLGDDGVSEIYGRGGSGGGGGGGGDWEYIRT